MEYIYSKDNRTLKHITALGHRKKRQEFGEYIVEGVRAIRDTLHIGAIHTIVIRESKRFDSHIVDILTCKDMDHIKVYVAQDPLFDKIEQSIHGQGIIGIAKKPSYDIKSLHIEDGLYVTLDGVQDPGNLGTIIRTAVAAGVKGIFLMKGTVDPFNDKTVRSTMSALHKIPLYEEVTISTLYDIVAEFNISTYVTTLEGATMYQSITYDKRTMIIVGNEGNGVSQEILNFSNHRITIPMYGDMESLNVGVAAALCMYKVQEQLLHV